jgi:hypothetical protein
MWRLHWPTSIVTPNHRILCRTRTVWLRLFARDPFPDIRWTVPKRDAVTFARTKEPNSVSIHEDDILEIQYDRPARRLSGQQCGQFANVVRSEATAQGQDNVAICLALDFQHSVLGDAGEQLRGQRKVLNLHML